MWPVWKINVGFGDKCTNINDKKFWKIEPSIIFPSCVSKQGGSTTLNPMHMILSIVWSESSGNGDWKCCNIILGGQGNYCWIKRPVKNFQIIVESNVY